MKESEIPATTTDAGIPAPSDDHSTAAIPHPGGYFAEVEQAAFEPANMVPGIGPSPDKMLLGRLFSYPDTHRHRIGANYLQLPISAHLRLGDRITHTWIVYALDVPSKSGYSLLLGDQLCFALYAASP